MFVSSRFWLAALCTAGGLLAAGRAQGQSRAGYVVSPVQPRAGSVVTLSYTPAPGSLSPGPVLRGVAYCYSNYAWQLDSLVLARAGTGWHATYHLPPAAAFVALRFYPTVGAPPADSLLRQGCFLVPRDKNGQRLPGGAVGEAIYRMPALASELPAGFPNEGGQASPATLAALLQEELARKGASPTQFVRPYLAIEHVLLGPAFARQAAPLLAPLAQASLAEADLIELHRTYASDLRDEAKARELEALLLRRYPKGHYARLAAFAQVNKSAQPAERIRAGEQFLRDFPQPPVTAAHYQPYPYYELNRALASAYFDAGAYDRLLAMCTHWGFRTENEVYRWNVTRAYAAKKVPLDSLYRVSTVLLQDLVAKVKDESYREVSAFGDEAKALEAARKELDQRLATHLALLLDLHRYPEALDYFARLSAAGQYADASLNEKHVQLLDALGQQAQVVQVLENSVRANAVTPAMSARLRQAYQASHPNGTGYDAYLASLRSQDEVAALHAYVEQHLLSKDYQPFALEDASGQLVRSSDWEGKIVVLDFWATWCGPCIRAFPGMQILVDTYAKDPLVDVYFVGTMQFGDYKEKDITYLKQQGYRFKLLLDAVDPQTKQQNAVFKTFALLFNSSGIPRKVIVKDGLIRYTSEGYSGSPSQLVDELSYAIELLKKQ